MTTTEPLPCPRCDADLRQSDACQACGTSATIVGGFRLEGVLGQGGMGRVYRVRRTADGVLAAAKIVRLADAEDFRSQELFEQGSKILAGLDLPGVPKVLAFDRTDKGELWLVREPFDGGTLEERVRAHGRSLTPSHFEALLTALLTLLGDLHDRLPPVIHRDIKPSNVMFRTAADWAPVLVDFDTVAGPAMARTGLTIVGTPGYVAPEQLAGIVSPACDLFSLGATFLFVATGADPDRLPRRDGRFDVPPELASLPASVSRVVMKLVEPERQNRYARARDALADLARRGADAADLRPAAASRPSKSKSGAIIAAACFAILCLCILFAVVATKRSKPPNPLCTLRTEPAGAEIVVIGKTDPLVGVDGKVLAPESEFEHPIGTTPFEQTREQWIIDSVVSHPVRVEARLSGYRTRVVGWPLAGMGCDEQTYTLERE